MSESKRLYFIAGENSGDQPAGKVIREILRSRPHWTVEGLGGPRMEEAGMNLMRNMVNDLAIVGFFEVLQKAPQIYKVWRMVKKHLEETRPDAVVLVDYPGFNLKLVAPFAHGLGIPVIYYIIPTFWAWHYDRVYKIKEYCDKVYPVYPFEEKMLENEGIDAEFLGSKDLDLIVITMTREEVFQEFGLDPNKKLIGLLPGSRRREIKALLPIMLEAAQRLYEERDDVQFVLPQAATIPTDMIDTYLTQYNVPIKVVDRYRLNVRHAMDFSWVASGTAATEGALIGKPFVVLYRANYFSALIIKRLINTPFVCIPNIVAGDMVIPELLQEKATAQNLFDHAQLYLNDHVTYENMKYQLRKIREKFGDTGSSQRVGRSIVDFVEGE